MHQTIPKALLTSLEGIAGFDKKSFEEIHAAGRQVTSIRINPSKLHHSNIELLADEFNIEHLSDHRISPQKIPWSSLGYYLSARPSFTSDPFFHAGLYYVQEASGMFIEQALRQSIDLSKPIKALDLCAAPGGKSTLIQSVISNESLLVCNEVIKTRLNILHENMTKWGSANVMVTNNDPKDFAKLENYFDVIIIDAPCSGSGLFRREAEAIDHWSEENVTLCSHRQQRILADAWPALKKNGILIYCTCSYSKKENEDILDWIMKTFSADSHKLEINHDWKIIETISDQSKAFGYRFYPDKLQGEGFFISCMQKKDGGEFLSPKKKKPPAEQLSKHESGLVNKYVSSPTGAVYPLSYIKYNGLAYALPAFFAEDLLYLQQHLYLKKAGILLGKIVHDELIPEHELALSTIITPFFPAINFDKPEAIQYLRKEEIKTDASYKGWALAQYKQKNLGWIKILHNRVNNYYPKTFRIMS